MKWFYCCALSEKYIDFIFSTSATASASALVNFDFVLKPFLINVCFKSINLPLQLLKYQL